MKPVLIIQNCEFETAGSTVDYMRDRRIPFILMQSYSGDSFPDQADISAIIAMGCPESVTRLNEFDYLKKLFQFVTASVRQNVPYLGVCFGGQLLAKVLGAEVNPNPVKEIGACKVSLTAEGKNDTLFAGFDNIFDVFQWHGDTFRVPFGAKLLVEGTECKNQAFRKGNLVGIQFHLETPLEEASVWCDKYAHELVEVGKTREQLTAGYRPIAETAKNLNYRLLDNFFQSIVTNR